MIINRIISSISEHDEQQFFHAYADLQQLELVILNRVPSTEIPGILRKLAAEIERQQESEKTGNTELPVSTHKS